MEGLFNQMAQLLVEWELLSGERLVALDSSKRKVQFKGHKEPMIEESGVYGLRS